MKSKQEIIQQKAHDLLLAIVEAYPCTIEEAGIVCRRKLAEEMTLREAHNLQELFSITSRVALSGFDVTRSLTDEENHSNALDTFRQNDACLSAQK